MNSLNSLQELALDATIKCFESSPFQAEKCLNNELAIAFFQKLPTHINESISAVYIENEEYWHKACNEVARASGRCMEEHGNSNKRMFFELMIGIILKAALNKDELPANALVDKVTPISDYIHTLRLGAVAHGFPIDVVAKYLPNLTTMDLKYPATCPIGVKRFVGLPKAIESSPNLITLVLRECHISDDDLTFLFGDVAEYTFLHLDLSNNEITSNGVKTIKQLFDPSESILTSLDLSGNKIDDIGALEIGNALAFNESLLSLNLRMNAIGDHGGEGLVSHLTENKILRRLDVSANELGSGSALAISRLIDAKISALESIILTSNNFMEGDLQTIGQHEVCCMKGAIAPMKGTGCLASEMPC